MKPLFVFIASLIILAALAVVYPNMLLNPGPLTKGHHALEKDCLACHTPFRGVKSVQCISCHKQQEIGINTVAGAVLPKNGSKVLFHKGLADNSCIECHTDHKKAFSTKTIKPFRHASLEPSLRNRCINCHKEQKPADALHKVAEGNCAECHSTTKWKPATFDHKKLTASGGKECFTCHKSDRPTDKLHQSVSTSCAECHSTTKWKPATFDHKKLTASGGKECFTCHKATLPNDTMHRQSSKNCGTCHSTSRWKPATFDHNRYFRLDRDHRASCKSCHTDPGNYKKYTCYNCHEHSESGIASKHRREGIYNYQNCMKCHRNGDSEGHGERGSDD